MLQGRYPQGAHLVLMVTSLALKSNGVRRVLDAAASHGVRVRPLLEREIAWKVWYAGPGGGVDHVLATREERKTRHRVGECDYFIGATEPDNRRFGGKTGGRMSYAGYHWHVAY